MCQRDAEKEEEKRFLKNLEYTGGEKGWKMIYLEIQEGDFMKGTKKEDRELADSVLKVSISANRKIVDREVSYVPGGN